MKILIQCSATLSHEWAMHEVSIGSFGEMVELTIDDEKGNLFSVQVKAKDLEYAIKAIRSAPDFEDESAEPSPD